MERIFKYFFGLWAGLFLLFAVWQWNDPDSILWIGIYSLAAILCVFAMFDRYSVPILSVGALVGLLVGFYLLSGSISNWISYEVQQANLSMMMNPDIEEARESFGLFIVSFVMGVAAYRGWSRNTRKTSHGQKGAKIPAPSFEEARV